MGPPAMSHLHLILWSTALEPAAVRRLALLLAGLFQVIRDVDRRYSQWHSAHRNSPVMVTAAAGLYARGKLLGIGCSQEPYLELFAPYVEEYVGLDTAGGYGRAAAADVRGQAVNLPADEPEAVRRRLRQLLTDSGMAERMCVAARDRVQADFTWGRTAEWCREAYTEGGRG